MTTHLTHFNLPLDPGTVGTLFPGGGRVEYVKKFGSAIGVGTSYTPVTNAKVYRTPLLNVALELISDNTNDSVAGTGAQVVTVQGLTVDSGTGDWIAAEESVALNGTTAVPLTTEFVRVFRMFIIRSGTYPDIPGTSQVGNIGLREAGAGQTWATLDLDGTDGDGQTLISAYTVRSGMTAGITNISITTDSAIAATVKLIARAGADDVVTPFLAANRVKRTWRSFLGGIEETPKTPIGPFVGPCDLVFVAKFASGTPDISINFDMVMVTT